METAAETEPKAREDPVVLMCLDDFVSRMQRYENLSPEEDPRHIARELREVTRDIRLSLGPPQVTARKLITRITTLLRGSAAKLSLSPHEDVREEASRILKRTESIENDYPPVA
ncbi:MAG: hypothetical protein AAB489_03500 [Patescibacteria group bacterium]